MQILAGVMSLMFVDISLNNPPPIFFRSNEHWQHQEVALATLARWWELFILTVHVFSPSH